MGLASKAGGKPCCISDDLHSFSTSILRNGQYPATDGPVSPVLISTFSFGVFEIWYRLSVQHVAKGLAFQSLPLTLYITDLAQSCPPW